MKLKVEKKLNKKLKLISNYIIMKKISSVFDHDKKSQLIKTETLLK
jgi:hypothetical protein